MIPNLFGKDMQFYYTVLMKVIWKGFPKKKTIFLTEIHPFYCKLII